MVMVVEMGFEILGLSCEGVDLGEKVKRAFLWVIKFYENRVS